MKNTNNSEPYFSTHEYGTKLTISTLNTELSLAKHRTEAELRKILSGHHIQLQIEKDPKDGKLRAYGVRPNLSTIVFGSAKGTEEEVIASVFEGFIGKYDGPPDSRR